MHTNPVTGEVTFELAGKTYRLHAGAKRLAEYQAAIVAPGLSSLLGMLAVQDGRALYHGLRCLCTSGNEADFDTMLILPHGEAIVEALTAAISAGMPIRDIGDKTENPRSATVIN